MTTRRVLITDGDNRSALAAVRSLGRRGHFVVTAGESPDCLAGVSRFTSVFVRCPSPVNDPQSFLAAILEVVREHRIDVVLPMTEITTLLLTEHRAALPASCVLPFADVDAIARASDKGAMVRLAREAGVPVPATIEAADLATALAKLDTLTYPVVLKPTRSRVRTATGWIDSSVSYAADRAELEARLRALAPENFPVLFQERIRGPGVGFFALYDRGRLVANFAHRRLREKPPSGGVSVLRESIPVDARALEYGTRLLGRLGWHGVAMVEFKQDERDGDLRLMEINARFWGSLQLAIDSGVDFPALLVAIAAGEPVEPVTSYRQGVRSRWLLGDLDVLLLLLTRSRRSLNLPPNYPSRLASLWDFLAFWRKNQSDEVWSSDDPRPGRLEWRRWLSVSK
jgi:predicted ATP-grasp superfamily ATP-dependent carboligase